MSPSLTAFRENAVARMLELGLTYKAIGDRVGLSPSNVHSYIKGKTVPGLEMVDRFAEALEMKTSELITPVSEEIST